MLHIVWDSFHPIHAHEDGHQDVGIALIKGLSLVISVFILIWIHIIISRLIFGWIIFCLRTSSTLRIILYIYMLSHFYPANPFLLTKRLSLQYNYWCFWFPLCFILPNVKNPAAIGSSNQSYRMLNWKYLTSEPSGAPTFRHCVDFDETNLCISFLQFTCSRWQFIPDIFQQNVIPFHTILLTII